MVGVVILCMVAFVGIAGFAIATTIAGKYMDDED